MTGLKKYVLIVAGGSGSRMGQKIPKQFIPVNGKPILIHTFEAFLKYSADVIFILVIPVSHIQTWKEICSEYDFTTPHVIREGGDTRFQSVKNGLGAIMDDGLVAIHDGVRPCVPVEVIESSFMVAEKEGSAVTAVSVSDSLRMKSESGSTPVNRDDYVMVQTPQTFWVDRIKKAYSIKEQKSFTDDASVYEASGMKITLIEGSDLNIKVTSPGDLSVVEGLLAGK